MLAPHEAQAEASRLWRLHLDERSEHDRIRGYLRGDLGRPSLPPGASGELQELARMSVKNVISLVVDSFVQSLSLVGFRSPSDDADAAVWDVWQRERMDARQAEVHRAAVTYGTSYVRESFGEDGAIGFHVRSPREIYAEYNDPSRDEWPTLALETWQERDGSRTVTRGMLWDSVAFYPVSIGGNSKSSRVDASVGSPHGFPHCPIVRFINERDTETSLVGEVEPLIVDQQAINAVNFDRLVVSRFGAFPQKYIFGWAPEDKDELERMSAMRVWAIDNPAQDMQAGTFSPANVTAYNQILDEMIAHVAVKARVPVFALTGQISNVGTETVALIDSPNQRKVKAKRLSFGESWEQALRLYASVSGANVPEDAEVVWDDTDARSFAQVVDGVSKLVAAGVPVSELIDQIPGLTQQKVDAINDAIRVANSQSMAAQIVTAVRGAQTDAQVA
jgi:hypothetical protein